MHSTPKTFMIILLLGLVLMTKRIQLKDKSSDKMNHETEGIDPIFGNMPTFLMMYRLQNTGTPEHQAPTAI
jgi:hypothetical protein